MSKKQPGLLVIMIFTWIVHFICAVIYGPSVWFVKVLSLLSVIFFGIFLFTIWKNKENKNDLII